MRFVQLLLFFVCVHHSVQQSFKRKPEQGIFTFTLPKQNGEGASKTLFSNSNIGIDVNTTSSKCTNSSSSVVLFRWLIVGIHCKGEFNNPNATRFITSKCFKDPDLCPFLYPGKYVMGSAFIKCGDLVSLKYVDEWKLLPTQVTEAPVTSTSITTQAASSAGNRKRRSDNDATSENEQHADVAAAAPVDKLLPNCVANTTFLGEYLVVVDIEDEIGHRFTEDDDDLYFQITVKMKGPQGYLSAHEYPLLIFYLVMCIVYIFYAMGWLVMSACNYHDLLRVQFWIGGVILLGLIEKAVHYSEYSTVNTTGVSAVGREKFAEVISAFKRSVSRMLVIIVSLGFGIVKPRLGPILHRVIGIGILYFAVAILEAMIRIDAYFKKNRSAWIVMYIPLAIIDSVICWWVFMSLLQTMKTLRLRRNTVKLSLYRHFANTIVFCVLVSLGMILWSIYYHEQVCVEDFSNEWFDTACWPILFSVILLVIMVLWRPNTNNQRYAYSPMIDGNDSDMEDMEEPMLGSGATENMKMRSSNRKGHLKSPGEKTEDDLKWIEENIPQTVADAALPALIDSDEEVIMIKHEMNKME